MRTLKRSIAVILLWVAPLALLGCRDGGTLRLDQHAYPIGAICIVKLGDALAKGNTLDYPWDQDFPQFGHNHDALLGQLRAVNDDWVVLQSTKPKSEGGGTNEAWIPRKHVTLILVSERFNHAPGQHPPR